MQLSDGTGGPGWYIKLNSIVIYGEGHVLLLAACLLQRDAGDTGSVDGANTHGMGM